MALLWLGACARPAPLKAPGFVRVSRARALDLASRLDPAAQGLGSWQALDLALSRSLEYVSARPGEETAVELPGLALSWAGLRASLEQLLADLPRLDRDPGLLARDFTWFAFVPEILLTGYYEPWVKACLSPDPDYPYPIHGPPQDLKVVDLGEFHPRWQGEKLVYRIQDGRIRPYHQRRDIDFGRALEGRGNEIAWARDLVDVYVLQVQGSGRLVLPGGEVRHVLYAGKNGRQYVSLGRTMAERGHLALDEVSMPRIREYLRAHPEDLEELLSANPSYVFFRLADDGPYGSMGKVLTPMVSLAVDRGLAPMGAAFFLDADMPVDQGPGAEPGLRDLAGLVLAQDTGGAIKGARADLFCGSDRSAEFAAGRLKHRAGLYLLVSRKVLAETAGP
ncbi:MAG: MltA domain-containing protein [Desulfovibrionaceae bacterium]|nr:MltA domain-containing protein [Desulfovibrionaceae bacterium]